MTQLRTLTTGQQLVGVGLPPVDLSTTETLFRPQSFASLEEARTALDAPADANYVYWPNGATSMEAVMASLSANDILVLPEREEPYLIDSSNGFILRRIWRRWYRSKRTQGRFYRPDCFEPTAVV